jgi:hypothetical protein
MKSGPLTDQVFRVGLRVLVLCLAFAKTLAADEPRQLLLTLDDYPHARQVAFAEESVIDHEVGLGAMKKVRGVWQFKHSERLTGVLTSYTWQIVDGFSSQEVMRELADRVQARTGTTLLFQCEGRACGPGAQWANRVFGQRILYGREDLQEYRVYAIADAEMAAEGEGAHRLVLYSAARTAERQYLHVELLTTE